MQAVAEQVARFEEDLAMAAVVVGDSAAAKALMIWSMRAEINKIIASDLFESGMCACSRVTVTQLRSILDSAWFGACKGNYDLYEHAREAFVSLGEMKNKKQKTEEEE